MIWIAIAEKSKPDLAERLDQIIFIDFLGYFIISLLFAGGDKSVRWRRSLRFEEGLRIGGYVALILVAGWFMEGIAGWGFTLVWMGGIAMSLSDVPFLRNGAIVRVVWGIASAFLVAIVGSFSGVPEDRLLQDHVPSLLAWGLLYFGGVVIVRIARIRSAWLSRSEGL